MLRGQAAAMDGNNEEALQFDWTSPLGGSPTSYHRVKGVVAEQAMVSIVTRCSPMLDLMSALTDLR